MIHFVAPLDERTAHDLHTIEGVIRCACGRGADHSSPGWNSDWRMVKEGLDGYRG